MVIRVGVAGSLSPAPDRDETSGPSLSLQDSRRSNRFLVVSISRYT